MSIVYDVSYGLTGALLELPAYPSSLTKFLIQIGHEPLAPVSSNILGRTFYPNSLKYLSHLRKTEGLLGLYRGLGMRIVSQTLGTVVYRVVSRDTDFKDQLEQEFEQNHTETMLEFFYKKTCKEINSTCWGILVSHPFHVMAMRAMAQCVGGESIYSSWNVFQNMSVIYRGEGVVGFYSGLIPRLILEVTAICVINGVAYTARAYFFDEDRFGKYIDKFAVAAAYLITYPLSVVSSVSCISGSGLKAALPPLMPNYSSWLGVLQHLYQTNGLQRGLRSFFRTYIEPIEYKVDEIY